MEMDHDHIKGQIVTLLQSEAPAGTSTGELQLAYVPATDHNPRHHLRLIRPGGRVSYNESQATLTALMAAIHACGHAIVDPGIEMALDQAIASRAGGDTPDYCTTYDWQIFRQMKLALGEQP